MTNAMVGAPDGRANQAPGCVWVIYQRLLNVLLVLDSDRVVVCFDEERQRYMDYVIANISRRFGNAA